MASCAAISLLLGLVFPGGTGAQEYPGRPVRMVVASSPGSGVDIVARIVAQRMSDAIGGQIFVDNRAGAAGTIGAQSVARSAPDGYTVLMIGPSFTINASLVRKLPYDVFHDFAPVGQASTGHYVVVVHPSLPVFSLKELIMFANITAVVPHVKTGRLRALAASGRSRSLALPDLPTVAEAGVPGYVVTSWFGIIAPSRVPQDIIARLNGALTTAMQERDMRDRLAGEGAEPAPSSPAEFGRLIASEVATWARVIKLAGVQ